MTREDYVAVFEAAQDVQRLLVKLRTRNAQVRDDMMNRLELIKDFMQSVTGPLETEPVRRRQHEEIPDMTDDQRARFEQAASAQGRPEFIEGGGMICGTPESIERFRLFTCLSGLRLESKGIRVRRGLSCLAVARRDYGIVASNATVAHARLWRRMYQYGLVDDENPLKSETVS